MSNPKLPRRGVSLGYCRMSCMLEMVVATVVQEVTKSAVGGAGGWSDKRGASRADRFECYSALERSVMRSQLRIDTLFTVHSAQYNIAHIAAWVSGYPLVVNLLNQLTDDLALVTSDWKRVRSVATPRATTAADDLVLALCAVMASVDPGWTKPRARAAHRRDLLQAKRGLTDAMSAFEVAAKADAAPRRRDRRAASAATRDDDA